MAMVCGEIYTAQVFERTLSRFWTEIEPHFTFSVKVMGGYILAQKLEIQRSKGFAVSILLETKAIRN